MKKYISFITDAIYPPRYHKLLQNNRARAVVLYFLLFIFLEMAIPLLFQIPVLKAVPSQFATYSSALINKFPTDAKIDIKDGVLTTNLDTPFIIPVEGDTKSKVKNILVLDTNANIEDFEDYSTYMLVTKTAFTAKSDSQMRVIPFRQFGNEPITITSQMISTLQKKIADTLTIYFVPVVVIGITLIVILASVVVWVASILWNTLLVTIILWLASVSIPLSKRVLLAATLGILTILWNTLWRFTSIQNPLSLPWVGTFAHSVILIMAAYTLREHHKKNKPWKTNWTLVYAIILTLLIMQSLRSMWY